MAEIAAKGKAQGDKIRGLKPAKSSKDIIDHEVKVSGALEAEFRTSKDVIDPEVKVLEALEAEFRVDGKSGVEVSGAVTKEARGGLDLVDKIRAQGDIVKRFEIVKKG